MNLLRPDRVAVVFDGHRSWQSRRRLIEQARALAVSRTRLLLLAADALQDEADALSQVLAAVVAGDQDQTRRRLSAAGDAALLAEERLANAASAVPAAQTAFAEEIFGVLGTLGSTNESTDATAAKAVYSALELDLAEGKFSENSLRVLQDREAASRRSNHALLDSANSAKKLVEFPSYKANRPQTPELVRSVLHEAPALVRSLGWPTFVVDGIEADDVIGQILSLCCGLSSVDSSSERSLVGAAMAPSSAGVTPFILSKDKDFTQLLDWCPDLLLVRPRHHGSNAQGHHDSYPGLESVGVENVPEKYVLCACLLPTVPSADLMCNQQYCLSSAVLCQTR